MLHDRPGQPTQFLSFFPDFSNILFGVILICFALGLRLLAAMRVGLAFEFTLFGAETMGICKGMVHPEVNQRLGKAQMVN